MADERVAAAEQAARAAVATPLNGDLRAHTKAELLDLAAAMDIEGRTGMTKAELVSAIEEGGRA
jgi:hypothetical protein